MCSTFYRKDLATLFAPATCTYRVYITRANGGRHLRSSGEQRRDHQDELWDDDDDGDEEGGGVQKIEE